MAIPQDKLIRILKDILITILFLSIAAIIIYFSYIYYLLGKAFGII